MDLTRDQFEDLVGAYAVDACEPDEADAMERYLATHPAAAREVERLRDVASSLATIGTSRPPVSLLDRLLDTAAERVAPADAGEALRKESDRFDRFLSTIEPAHLAVRTENGLTVHELVQHVEAVDRAFVEAARRGSPAFIGADEAASITAAELPEHAGESFAQTITRLRGTRRELVGLRDEIPPEQRVAGYRRDDALVIRAFETWTHDDDIRRALGHDLAVPDAAVMRTMAELAMATLPLAMAARGLEHPGVTARVVLTGPGGGEWTVPCAVVDDPSARPDVVVRASVVDWCRRFADRIDPAAVLGHVEGDEAVARDMVDAAAAFAGL